MTTDEQDSQNADDMRIWKKEAYFLKVCLYILHLRFKNVFCLFLLLFRQPVTMHLRSKIYVAS